MRQRSGGRQAGYSLFELVVAMVVLAILTAIAVPNFSRMVQAHRLQALLGSLRTALAYARTEAVLRQYSVSVCASGGSQSGCAGAGDYGSGWLVYATPGLPGQSYTGAAPMQLLRVGSGDARVSVQASNAAAISFGPQGQVVGAQGVSFTLCPRGADGSGQSTASVPGQLLSVSAQGSLSVQPLAAQASCAAAPAP